MVRFISILSKITRLNITTELKDKRIADEVMELKSQAKHAKSDLKKLQSSPVRPFPNIARSCGLTCVSGPHRRVEETE